MFKSIYVVKIYMVKQVLVGIDRDGTINKDEEGFFGKNEDWKEKFEFCYKVVEGLRLLNKCEQIKTAVITNASGIPWKHYTFERSKEINNYIRELLSKDSAGIDNWQINPYYSKSYAKMKGIPNYENNEWVLEDDDERMNLRKPNIGMLKKAAQEMDLELSDFDKIYVIGDRLVDVETGINAKGKSILVSNGLNNSAVEELRAIGDKRKIVVDNFYDACEFIVKEVSED